TTNQIKANELVKQINETAQRLSSLINSDSKNLQGFAFTQVTSFIDEKGYIQVYSFSTGKGDELSKLQTDLMIKNNSYFHAIFNALAKTFERKKNYVKGVLRKVLEKNKRS
ncbi:MAG: hypothetical protein C4308_14995, partial [Chitinophagaceae bacterium]